MKKTWDGAGVSVLAAKLCLVPGEGSFWRHPECACTAALIELLLTLIRGSDLISVKGGQEGGQNGQCFNLTPFSVFFL